MAYTGKNVSTTLYDTYSQDDVNNGFVAKDGGGNVTVDGALTLSNGVYLGGTSSANYLDDYEEGTWTPAFTNVAPPTMTSSGTYTKIGRLVYCTATYAVTSIDTSDGSGIAIYNLPYIADGNMPCNFSLGQRFSLLGAKSTLVNGVVAVTDAVFLLENSLNYILYNEMSSSGELDIAFMYYT